LGPNGHSKDPTFAADDPDTLPFTGNTRAWSINTRSPGRTVIIPILDVPGVQKQQAVEGRYRNRSATPVVFG
jgi:hypothetical protein